jgi:hypothetical protein
MWQDESLHVRSARGYSGELVWEVWSHSGQVAKNVLDNGDGYPFFETGKQAWIAAIEAAPEPK